MVIWTIQIVYLIGDSILIKQTVLSTKYFNNTVEHCGWRFCEKLLVVSSFVSVIFFSKTKCSFSQKELVSVRNDDNRGISNYSYQVSKSLNN